MSAQHMQEPPYPGQWTRMMYPGTGPWSVGEVFVDLANAQIAMLVEERHCNAYAVMHGGAMATLLDSQIAATRTYSRGAEDHTPTISLSVDYVAPAPQGAWLLIKVDLQKTTGSMAFTRAEVTIDGQIVARSSAIYHARKTRTIS